MMMLLDNVSVRPRDDDRCVYMQALYMPWVLCHSSHAPVFLKTCKPSLSADCALK